MKCTLRVTNNKYRLKSPKDGLYPLLTLEAMTKHDCKVIESDELIIVEFSNLSDAEWALSYINNNA